MNEGEFPSTNNFRGGTKMRRQMIAGTCAILMLMSFSAMALAAGNDEDTNMKMVDARVVEVSDMRISVIARTGVEHVIAIDNTRTSVSLNGREISLRDLREGDIVTIQLDERSQVNLARNIQIGVQTNAQVARID